MKFFTLIALAGTAFAARLTHNHHVHHNDFHVMHKALAKAKVHKQMKIKSMLKAKWDDLSEAQMEEIGAWFEHELTTGEETITWDELKQGIKEFGKKHGFKPLPKEIWAEIEKGFKMVDTDNSGSVDLAELEAAMEHM